MTLSAVEAEAAVVGAIMSGHPSADEVMASLPADDLTHPPARYAFEAALALSGESMTVGRTTVRERSGVSFDDIDHMTKSAVGLTDGEVMSLVREVKRVAAIRRIHKLCTETASRVHKSVSLEDLVGHIESRLYGLDGAGSGEAVDGSDVYNRVLDEFMQRYSKGGGVFISTGLHELDKAIIGLREGKMFVVAGRPGMGKTSIADTIRRNVLDQGHGVVQFSLEMGAEEIMEREISFRSQVNLRNIMSATGLTNEELERIHQSVGRSRHGLWFIDDRTFSISGMRRRARIQASKLARAGLKLGLVIIDYLQLAGDNGEHREQSVAAVSRGCKMMAKELGCTVMALSQLNRSCESREDKRPLMADLRESGSIEQDADIVGFVYRDWVYNKTSSEESAEFIIRKHRAGPLGTVPLRFIPRLSSFTDPLKVEWRSDEKEES